MSPFDGAASAKVVGVGAGSDGAPYRDGHLLALREVWLRVRSAPDGRVLEDLLDQSTAVPTELVVDAERAGADGFDAGPDVGRRNERRDPLEELG